MTLLRVVTSPDRLSPLIDALMLIGVTGMTITDLRGTSGARHSVSYRGSAYEVAYIPRLELQVVVNADEYSEAINEILEVARTVTHGENRIAVLPVEAAYRIRSGTLDYSRDTAGVGLTD